MKRILLSVVLSLLNLAWGGTKTRLGYSGIRKFDMHCISETTRSSLPFEIGKLAVARRSRVSIIDWGSKGRRGLLPSSFEFVLTDLWYFESHAFRKCNGSSVCSFSLPEATRPGRTARFWPTTRYPRYAEMGSGTWSG